MDTEALDGLLIRRLEVEAVDDDLLGPVGRLDDARGDLAAGDLVERVEVDEDDVRLEGHQLLLGVVDGVGELHLVAAAAAALIGEAGAQVRGEPVLLMGEHLGDEEQLRGRRAVNGSALGKLFDPPLGIGEHLDDLLLQRIEADGLGEEGVDADGLGRLLVLLVVGGDDKPLHRRVVALDDFEELEAVHSGELDVDEC